MTAHGALQRTDTKLRPVDGQLGDALGLVVEDVAVLVAFAGIPRDESTGLMVYGA